MLECKRYSKDKKAIWDPIARSPGQPKQPPVRMTLLGSGGSGTLITGVPEEEDNEPEGFTWRVRTVELEPLPPPPPRERWTGLRLMPDTKRTFEEERDLDDATREKEAKKAKRKREEELRRFIHPKEWKYSPTTRYLREAFGLHNQEKKDYEREDDILSGPTEERWVRLQERRRKALKERYLDSLPKMNICKRRQMRKKADKIFGPEMGYVGPVCPPTCKRKMNPELIAKLNTCLELRTKPCLTQQMPLEFTHEGEPICRAKGSLICQKRQEIRKLQEVSGEFFGEESMSDEGDEEDEGDYYGSGYQFESEKPKICKSVCSGKPKMDSPRTDEGLKVCKSICPDRQNRNKRECTRECSMEAWRERTISDMPCELFENIQQMPGGCFDKCPPTRRHRRTADSKRCGKRRHHKDSSSTSSKQHRRDKDSRRHRGYHEDCVPPEQTPKPNKCA